MPMSRTTTGTVFVIGTLGTALTAPLTRLCLAR